MGLVQQLGLLPGPECFFTTSAYLRRNCLHIVRHTTVNFFLFGRSEGLSPVAVQSVDFWFDSGVQWWFHFSSIVTYYSYLVYKAPKTCWFRHKITKGGIHLVQAFLVDKCSCQMVHDLCSDIIRGSAISGKFALLSSIMILRTFFTFLEQRPTSCEQHQYPYYFI